MAFGAGGSYGQIGRGRRCLCTMKKSMLFCCLLVLTHTVNFSRVSFWGAREDGYKEIIKNNNGRNQAAEKLGNS